VDIVDFFEEFSCSSEVQKCRIQWKYNSAVDVHRTKLLIKEEVLVWVILSKERQIDGSFMKLKCW